MIYPTDDKILSEDIDLICDNLFRIFQVKCPDEDRFKLALTKEITQFMKGSGYHKNCQIT